MALKSLVRRTHKKRVRSSPRRGKSAATKGKKRTLHNKTKNIKRRANLRRRSMHKRKGGSSFSMAQNYSGGSMLPLAPHPFPEGNHNLRGPPFPPLGGPSHHA